MLEILSDVGPDHPFFLRFCDSIRMDLRMPPMSNAEDVHAAMVQLPFFRKQVDFVGALKQRVRRSRYPISTSPRCCA